jgi:hypothetical protein
MMEQQRRTTPPEVLRTHDWATTVLRTAPDREGGRDLSWRQAADGVSLGRAKADSPPPRDGPQHPVFEIGFASLPRAVQRRGGE